MSLLWMGVLGSNIPWVYAQGTGGASGAVDLTTAVGHVAKQTIPAVVHIEVTERQEVANPFTPFEGDPLFRRFFDVPRIPRKFRREIMGLGTGMIMATSRRSSTDSIPMFSGDASCLQEACSFHIGTAGVSATDHALLPRPNTAYPSLP